LKNISSENIVTISITKKINISDKKRENITWHIKWLKMAIIEYRTQI